MHWDKRYKCYVSGMVINGKRYDLGRYQTFEEARAARIRAEYMYLIPFIEEGTVSL